MMGTAWKRLTAAGLGLLGMVGVLWAQYNLPRFPSTSQAVYARATYLPSSPANLAGQDVVVTLLVFANDDNAAVAVVRVTDGTTDCGGAGCPLVPSVSVQPNSVAVVVGGGTGIVSKGGFNWSATGSAKVYGQVGLRY